MAMASKVCDALMFAIKTSQLDFVIQETPYSSFVTIRKKFKKSFSSSDEVTEVDNRVDNETLRELNLENCKLKEMIKEKDAQFESVKKNSIMIQEKLENVEKDIFKHHEERDKQKARLAEEVSNLKAQIKEKSDSILVYKADAVKAVKTIKSLEKEVHNYEKKTRNLEDKIGTINSDKIEVRKERDRLANEIKNLKSSKKQKILKSLATQTETKAREESEINNNFPKYSKVLSSTTPRSSTHSRASQTCSSIIKVSTASQTSCLSQELLSSVEDKSCLQSETFDCVLCHEKFSTADSLQVHSQSEHDILLNPDKLTDHNEEDAFVRFIKSMEVGDEYIEERKKLYPSHWDHLSERVKIRKLAQIKLTITSRCIEENMKKNDVRKIKDSGLSYECNTI